MLARPASSEYAEFYGKYVALVPDGDFASVMTSGHAALLARLKSGSAKAGDRYAEGKWTLAESVQHLSDAERVFAYRMLCFARGGREPQPPFDENTWTPASQANARDFGGLLDEFATVRRSTILLVNSVPFAAWANLGVMSGNPASARGVAYIIAGHERHHDALFRDRYGV